MVKTENDRVESSLWEELLLILNILNDNTPVKEHISLVSRLKVIKRKSLFKEWHKLLISTPVFKVKQPSYMLDCVF